MSTDVKASPPFISRTGFNIFRRRSLTTPRIKFKSWSGLLCQRATSLWYPQWSLHLGNNFHRKTDEEWRTTIQRMIQKIQRRNKLFWSELHQNFIIFIGSEAQTVLFLLRLSSTFRRCKAEHLMLGTHSNYLDLFGNFGGKWVILNTLMQNMHLFSFLSVSVGTGLLLLRSWTRPECRISSWRLWFTNGVCFAVCQVHEALILAHDMHSCNREDRAVGVVSWNRQPFHRTPLSNMVERCRKMSKEVCIERIWTRSNFNFAASSISMNSWAQLTNLDNILEPVVKMVKKVWVL